MQRVPEILWLPERIQHTKDGDNCIKEFNDAIGLTYRLDILTWLLDTHRSHVINGS